MIEASTIIFITILVAVAWVIFVAWWDEEHKGKKKNLQPPTKKYEKNSEIWKSNLTNKLLFCIVSSNGE